MNSEGASEETIRKFYCAALLASEVLREIAFKLPHTYSTKNVLAELIEALDAFEREWPELVQRTPYVIIRL